jgi:hypothetical protein
LKKAGLQDAFFSILLTPPSGSQTTPPFLWSACFRPRFSQEPEPEADWEFIEDAAEALLDRGSAARHLTCLSSAS